MMTIRACVAISVLLMGLGLAAAPAAPAAFPISDSSFKCITEMTHVRHFYVDNLAGNLAGTVKVAQAGIGDYPVGSVLQLVPNEVMVKREKGFNSGTRDWEFIDLNIAPASSTIRVRGVQEVFNRFGGNCFSCHVKARPEFDLVCDNNHGCDPIPITRAMSAALQHTAWCDRQSVGRGEAGRNTKPNTTKITSAAAAGIGQIACQSCVTCRQACAAAAASLQLELLTA
jgi:hypothetical protein